ncbi:Cell wall-associated hydrolase, NlpC family [Klenkia marina]|uniref:Cell wall-associated hydrolase, NlpC family n=1 Tax=Klenkia marina TaxID=1960309 RepID=A0A1G4XUW0_9ACTN|nr:C40 family peptidase [Klenkia marina]SCX44991.1 Cell wall-associated hydrolase, NlpC family [Klenkia marina]
MASTSTPARRPALRGRRAAITLLAAAGVAAGTFVTTPAQAAPGDPQPTTAAEAAQLIVDRGQQLEVLTEQFNDARVALDTDQAAAAQAAATAQAAQAALTAAQGTVTDVARSAYQGGNQFNSLQALLTSQSAGEFVEQSATLDLISQHTTDVLAQAQAANDAAAAAQQQAEQATADAQAQFDAVAAQQATLNTEIAAYQAQYAQLTAAEQAAVASTGDVATTGTASTSGGSARSGGASQSVGSVVANSAAAQTAVDTALAQQGDPYVWAASGPDSFDCSGLVQYAYAAAGVSLPHSSKGQASMGVAVSRGELQPGDLVAFYSPVSHIGIYIGNGMMVHAPTSGDVVKVASIDAMGSSPTAYRRLAG